MCTAIAPFPRLNVASCQAIQTQIGQIVAFGDGNKFLNANEFKVCNSAATAMGKTDEARGQAGGTQGGTQSGDKTAPGAPATGPPPPSYTARTAGPVKKRGIIEAAGTKWSCRKDMCTATAPFPPLNVASCHAVQTQVGNIAAFGDGKNFLSASDLKVCNSTATVKTEGAGAPSTAPSGGTGTGVKGAGTLTPPGGITPPAGTSLGTAALTPALLRQITDRTDRFRHLQATVTTQHNEAEQQAERQVGGHSGDTTSQGESCDDGRGSVHPGATEACNLFDDNCDGNVDEGVMATFYLDADGDGHGDPARSFMACPMQIGTAAEGGALLMPLGNDCDDSNPDRWHDC